MFSAVHVVPNLEHVVFPQTKLSCHYFKAIFLLVPEEHKERDGFVQQAETHCEILARVFMRSQTEALIHNHFIISTQQLRDFLLDNCITE